MLPRLRADLAALETRLKQFETEARALSEPQLRFRPCEGSWSIAEVAQHLLQVEREVASAAAKPGVARKGRSRTLKEWVRFCGFLAIVKLNRRIEIPREVAGMVTPNAQPDMDSLWREWSQVRSAIAIHLESVGPDGVREMAFNHPVIGPTPVKGMLPFLLMHFDHHMRQVVRIRRSPGFPRA